MQCVRITPAFPKYDRYHFLALAFTRNFFGNSVSVCFEVIFHAPYSPGLSSSDFWLFLTMKDNFTFLMSFRMIDIFIVSHES